MTEKSKTQPDFWGFYRTNSKIEVCFAEPISECGKKIVSAHSLQRNGILDQVEDERKGGKKLYSLEDWILDDDNRIIDFKLVGKKSASVFSGFCSKHDIELFAPIEQHPFSFTDQQLFLYYYRGFAHSHHNITEQCKFRKYVIENYPPKNDNFRLRTQRKEYEIEYKVFWEIYQLGMKVRERLNAMLLKNDYSIMEHYYRVVPYNRIASSQRIVPSFTYSNQSLKRWESISQVILTVIPDTKRTLILFSFFKNDYKGIEFIKDLKVLPLEEFTQAVSSVLLHSGMNTFFSPNLWESFSNVQKANIITDMNYLIHHARTHEGFYRCKENFFQNCI